MYILISGFTGLDTGESCTPLCDIAASRVPLEDVEPGSLNSKSLFQSVDGAIAKATWNSSAGTLKLILANQAGLDPFKQYSFQFKLKNGLSQASSGSLYISAFVNGTCTTLDSTGFFCSGLLMNQSKGSQLEVCPPRFDVRTAWQHFPWQGCDSRLNSIIIRLQSNVKLTVGSRITISGFYGVTQLESLNSSVSVVSGSAFLDIVSGQTLIPGVTYTYVFSMLNPPASQSAQELLIEASSRQPDFRIYPAPILGDPATQPILFFGSDFSLYSNRTFPGEALPLYVAQSAFVVKDISQDNPFPAGRNKITVTIAANVPLEQGSVLTLQGLIGSATLDSDLLLSYTSGATQVFGTMGKWSAVNSSLRLTVRSKWRVIDPYIALSFELTNGKQCQDSPNVTISAILAGLTSPVCPASSSPPLFGSICKPDLSSDSVLSLDDAVFGMRARTLIGWDLTLSSPVQSISIGTSVQSLVIFNRGSGCVHSLTGNSTFSGNLLFSSGDAAGTFDVVGGKLSAVALAYGGIGYDSPPSISGFNCTSAPTIDVSLGHGRGCRDPAGTLIFVGGGGFGAAGRYTASGGAIESVELLSRGRSYTSSPTILVSDESCTAYRIVPQLAQDSIAGVRRSVTSVTKLSNYNSTVTVSTDFPYLSLPDESTTYDLSPPNGSIESRSDGFVAYPVQNSVSEFSLDYHLTLSSSMLRSGTIQFSTSIQSIELTYSIASLVIESGGAECPVLTGKLSFSGSGGAKGMFQTVGGVVVSVILTNGGSGYTDRPTATAVGCSGAVITAILSIPAPIDKGAISSLISAKDVPECVNQSGQVNFSGGGGFGASALYDVINGRISRLTLTDRGKGFKAPPTATITGCPSAVLKVGIVFDSDSINGVSSLTIQSGGINCSSQSGLLGFDSGGSAAGTYSVRAGSVVSVQLLASGSGYTIPPNVVALGAGCSTPPVIVATIAQSTGLCQAPSGSLVFSGGGGTGASGVYTASGGRVTSVTLTSEGKFYTGLPKVSLSDPSCSFDAIKVTLKESGIAGHSRIVSTATVSSVFDSALAVSVGSAFPNIPSKQTFYSLNISDVATGSRSFLRGSIASTPANTFKSFMVDYNVSTVSRQYVDNDVTFSSSLAALKGGSIVQLSVATDGTGCQPGSGMLVFEDGGGLSARGNYTVSVFNTVTSSEIFLSSSGSGYSQQPTVRALGLYCTTMPTFRTIISFGGSGCVLSQGILVFSGGGGSGAQGRYTTRQGAILSVTLTNGGSYFVSPPIVTVADQFCTSYSILPILFDGSLAGFSRRISSVSTFAALDNILGMELQSPLNSVPSSATTYALNNSASDQGGTSPVSGIVADSGTGGISTTFYVQTDIKSTDSVIYLTAGTAFSVSSLVNGNLLLVSTEIITIAGRCSEASGCIVTRGSKGTAPSDFPAGIPVLLLQRNDSASGLEFFIAASFGPRNNTIYLQSTVAFMLNSDDVLLVSSTKEALRISSSCMVSNIVAACSVDRGQATPLSFPTFKGGFDGLQSAGINTPVVLIKRPAKAVDFPVVFTVASTLTSVARTVVINSNPLFPVDWLTDGDTLLIGNEVIRVAGVCGSMGVCPIMRGQLGTKASSADVNATVLLHTPFSSAGFSQTVSTYPLDYHVAPVSGQYVGWNLTLSTSVASVSGTMVTQLTLAKANWCGCTGTSGDLIFNGG